MSQMFNVLSDLKWFFEVHARWKKPKWCRCLVLHGNEDCPTKADLYEQNEPTIYDKPVCSIVFPD